jgi:hypothetical protein
MIPMTIGSVATFRGNPITIVGEDLTKFLVNDGGDFSFWAKRGDVKSIPIPKKTDVQNALEVDPSALNEFAVVFKQNGRLEISCQPSKIDQLASELSSVSVQLTELNAVDYIRPTSERSHAAKFDILVSPPSHLVDRLGVFFDFNGHRAREGEAQINSRPLAEWLMKNHDVLPVKVGTSA